MKAKIIITLLILLLVTSCITVEVAKEDTPEEETILIEPGEIIEEIIEEEIEEVQEFDLSVETNEYKINLGSSQTVENMNIEVTGMTSSAELTFNLDGEQKKIRETKTKEIYNNYYFSIQEYYYKGDSSNSYVVLKIEPINLESNQYLIDKGYTVNVLEKDITLEDSKSDGYIRVSVCNEETLICESFVTINKGESKEILGLTVKNIESYYRIKQYAILEFS
ncbi:hypothetical protein CL616_02380 [archaeon]|nr:hypothetical protein [archaeon]|tara:strand:+ start:261 stop:926 length:666 start_codon:yes stop_codon:yes gene_type:complete